MKKTLFSIAFLAASGAYVAAANHVFDSGALPTTADALSAASVAGDQPAAALVPSRALPPAAPTPLVTRQAPTPGDVPQTVAEAAPPAVSPVEAAPVPLPRPRPAAPAVQTAAATDTGTGGLRDGTYTGSSENAYYGRVQVQVSISNHQVAAVKVLDYPQDRRTSRYINSQALPLLQQEVIGATSANIDTVSGATLTSEAYIRSLGNALQQAGGGNA